jgi:hypothetical protein
MTKDIFIPTKGAMTELMEDTFEKILERKFPKLVRSARRKEWLTTADFEEIFGVSRTLQKHYRDNLDLPFYQESKKIVYKTEEVEKWFDQRKVNRKK